LISLTSEERRMRPHIAQHTFPGVANPRGCLQRSNENASICHGTAILTSRVGIEAAGRVRVSRR
jgi:hypothetical protein